MNVIEINNLQKHFGKIQALKGINLQVAEGEIFGFLGPNGAGKTTTIRCIMNFLNPNEGNVKVLGLDSVKDSVEIKDQIGYLTGDVRLYDGWTGHEHINFLEGLRGQKSNAKNLIEKLNFNPRVRFRTLSSGNKQKLGLILALMFSPKLIILDEPTVGLDPLLQNTVYELLEDLKKQGSTIFMSSHNLSEVDRICSRVGIIKDGQIVATENIQELKDKRMHTAIVRFEATFNQTEFNFENVVVEEVLPDGLVLSIKGQINSLIQKLANYQIKDLEISHASLEEIFFEYYGGPSKKPSFEKPLEFPPPEIKRNTNSSNDLTQIPKLEE